MFTALYSSSSCLPIVANETFIFYATEAFHVFLRSFINTNITVQTHSPSPGLCTHIDTTESGR